MDLRTEEAGNEAGITSQQVRTDESGPFTVSVIVPCHNHAAVLPRALGSVLRQTALPLEIIVIDDASTDGSCAAAQAFARQSSVPVSVISLPVNVGPGAARNAGWALASGTYLAFLDADDAWHPQKLEFQCRVLDLDPELALVGHGFEVQDNPDMGFPVIPGVSARRLSTWEMMTRNRLPTPSVILRRSLIERFVESQRYGEDYLLWLEIMLRGGRAALLDRSLLRLHKSSYGEGGLSAQLWAMQRAELGVFVHLYRLGLLRTLPFCGALLLSTVKFIRRVVFVQMGLFRRTR